MNTEKIKNIKKSEEPMMLTVNGHPAIWGTTDTDQNPTTQTSDPTSGIPLTTTHIIGF